MTPRRHLAIAALAWAVLSAVSMLLVAGTQILPQVATREAEIEDRAMVLLTVVSMPVLMFVVVVMAYSAFAFRAGAQDADGPPLHGHRGVQTTWLLVSSCLVLGLFVYGTLGLLEIRGSQDAEFEVQVRAEQWAWHFTYPASGVESDELHVPVNTRVKLVIRSDDAIHSLWVPAFGVKQDAVPGRETHAFVTPTQVGTFGGQCAELCGFGHTGMTTQVTVQTEAELASWLLTQPKAE
jgi:cytochrome c oxidase subunit 2